MKEYLKIVILFLYALATIMTCAAVWNSRPGAFISIVAVLLLLANGYVIYRGAKGLNLTKKNDANEG